VPDEKKPTAACRGLRARAWGKWGRKSPGQIAIGADYKHLVSFGEWQKGIRFFIPAGFEKYQSA